MPTYSEMKAIALSNPATSDRLKRAIMLFEAADPLDAQLDAAYLAKLTSARAEEALERAQHHLPPKDRS